MKKLRSFLMISICMMAMLFCTMALKAEAANVTTGTIGDNKGITWTYDADTKTLTVTGTDSGLQGRYDSRAYAIKSPFADICEDVEIIKLQNCTIKGNAEYMFEALKSLKSVQFQNVNTSNVTSMEGMFRNCTSLSSLDLSGLDTGNVTSMHSMFSGCSNLKSLNLSGFNTGKVTTMSFMFDGCSSLSSLDLKSFNTGNVTSMYWMFYDCHSLSSLDVSKFDTKNVTSMSGMFFDCRSLSSLNVSNFNTGKVTSMDEMFYNCRSLSSLNVSSFNTANVTTMSEMFRSCSGLSSLDVSNFNTEKVIFMSSMFDNCSGLSSLDISNFNTGALEYTTNMFSNCMNLVFIKTPKAISETVSIYLPVTFANPKNERTKYITKDFANTTLTNVDYLVSKIVLNASTLTVYMGKTGQLTATVSPEKALDKSLTWKSSNTAVAKVDANGKVTPVAPGTATITATATDIGGVSASCSVTVIQPVTGIAVNKTSLSLKTGAAETLTVTVSPGNATNKAVTWKSSNTSIATVDSNGKVTAVGPGTATITATAKDGSSKSASCSVTVTQPVTGITLNKTSVSIKVGGTETLTVTVSPSNASNKAVTWKSSNTAVATVDSNGKVTAVGGGTATITATAKDGSGKSASCSVTVIQPVTGIALNKTSASIKVGGSEILTVTVSPSNATNKAVTWKSSNTAVATVDANGKVSAVGPGTATITATAKDGSGKSASCSVTVTQPVTGIALNKTTLSLKTGATETLTVTVSPSNASNKAVAWKSSNTAVATVDSNGKVTAVGPGTATITATAKDGSGKSASCSVTVTQPVTGITLSKTSASIKVGGTETLTVTVSPGNATNKAVTWKSSNTAVATVDSSGKVTAVAVGTATITATAKDGSGKSASCEVTVFRPVTGITLNKTSLSLKTGATETLTVTVSPSNATNKAVTWKTSNTAVATVDANGKVTAVGPGTATITATAKDGSGKSASCSVTVTQPVTAVALNKTATTIHLGKSETLTVTVSPDNASNKAVTWKSSNTAVATVDANGKVTAVAVGTATITVMANDGSGKSAGCEVTVICPVTDVILNKNSVELVTGENETLTVTVKPDNASNKAVTWASSDTTVAAVDSNGKITAVGVGTATITVTAKDGSGKSASCIVKVMSERERQVRAFVERMYTVALGRAAEADGLDFYTEKLLAGDSNGACLAESFLCSPEFLNKGYNDAEYVKVLYRTFFDREPAAEEVNYWVGQLDSGKTRAFVLAGFVNSVEFDNLCTSYGISRGFMREDGKPINPGIGRFAERLYTVVLERAGEKDGIEYWSLNMANGTCTPKDAAKSFFLSQEYINKNTSDAQYITTLYRTFMDREPEAGGVEYWQNVLNNGATREQILEGFADSAEFKGIMASFGL